MSVHDASTLTGSWAGARIGSARPRLRLLCLPHAGGGAAAFNAWRPHVPAGVQLVPVELPGRGARLDEPLPSGLGALVEGMLNGVRAELSTPYALFGHSFGASVAYELTLRIEREGLRPPNGLVVSAARAPHLPLGREALGLADDEELIAWLRRGDGLPAELLRFPDFLRDLLRAVRADLAMAETYRIPSPAPVPCPVLALAGDRDETVTEAQVEPWRAYASGGYRMRTLPGGHAFPRTHPGRTLSAVLEGLRALGAFAGEGDREG